MSKFEIYQPEPNKKWYWRLCCGDICATGGQGHPSEEDARDEIYKVIEDVNEDVTKRGFGLEEEVELEEKEADNELMIGFMCFKSKKSKKNNKWYWRLKDKKGNIIAIGHQPFFNKEKASKEINIVRIEIAAKGDVAGWKIYIHVLDVLKKEPKPPLTPPALPPQ